MEDLTQSRRCPLTSPAAARSTENAGNGLRLPPGPRGHWLVGVLPEVRREGVDFRLRMLHDYGDIVSYRFLARTSVAIHHPDYVEHVLVHNYSNYSKAYLRGSSYETLFGNGLLASDGELWKRQRRLAQPAFAAAHLAEMSRVMAESVGDLTRRWHREQPGELDVAAEMSRLAFRIVGTTLFSHDLSDRSSSLAASLDVVRERLLLPPGPRLAYFVLWRHLAFLPRPRDRVFAREYRRLVDLIEDLVEKHCDTAGDDLLSRFIAARDDETGEGMGVTQLRDELITMLLAGHETVAGALSWTWYLLSKHPEAEARLHREVDAVMGHRDVPEFEDLPQLSYTKRILQESMRLFPPVPVITRRTIEDDEIDGYRIPADTVIVISPYAIQRHPRYWPRPEEFDPDRFLPARDRQRPAFAYLPFGGGPRRCIGQDFALVELQLAVAAIARKFQLRLPEGTRVVPEARTTLRPSGGLPMHLEARR